MKRIYMVDADRGFVQHCENLLFTKAQDKYKMLGHNFKANEFLIKIKERPDILDKIDLLLVNPKLNDLNGLELVKKVQALKNDIEICIVVNENIKSFYENDIAELGINHVLIYPNEDSYYLNMINRCFDDREKEILRNQNTKGLKSSNTSDKEVFDELISSDFLSQFDFDSLADNFFEEEKSKETKVEMKERNVTDDKEIVDKFKNLRSFDSSSSFEEKEESFFKETPKKEFVKPTFMDSFEYEDDFLSTAKPPILETKQNEYSEDKSFYDNTPRIEVPSFEDGYSFGGSFNPVNDSPYKNSYEEVTVESPYEDEAPHGGSNLQNINRPDFENMDYFNSYDSPVENRGNSNRFIEHENHSDDYIMPNPNRFNDLDDEYTNRKTPNSNNFGGYGYDDIADKRPSGQYLRNYEERREDNRFNEPRKEKTEDFSKRDEYNPYNDYVKTREYGRERKEEKIEDNVFSKRGFDPYEKPMDFSRDNPREMSKTQDSLYKPINDESQFEGFNFETDKYKTDRNISQRRGEDEYQDFEDMNSHSNRSVIENMYNKSGIDSLDYKPEYRDVKREAERDIHYKKTPDSQYKEVPDFAKQVVAFYSTKGGIGKTTLAINTAIQLAKYSKKKICIIDFDLTNANIDFHLGIFDSIYDLSVVSNFESEIDSFSLSRIITPYKVKDKNGQNIEFDVIVGFKEIRMAQRFSDKEVHKILSILEEMYDVVIVDTHPVYTDLAISTILKKATKIIFVTEQDATALNGAKDFIVASGRYGITDEKLFMVLNRYDSQTTVFSKNGVENSLSKKVFATVPFNMDKLREAVNTNIPITLSDPDGDIARAYIDIAKIIDSKLEIPEEPKGFFGRFKR